MEQTENINMLNGQVEQTLPAGNQSVDTSIPPIQQSSNPRTNFNPPVNPGDGSKTVLLVAVALFLISLVFLGIYFINAYRENRIGKSTPTPTPQEEVIETVAPTILPTGEDVVLNENEETSTSSATPKHSTSPSPSASPDSFEDFSEIMR